MKGMIIKRGTPEYAEYFPPLMLYTGREYLAYVMGSKVNEVLQNLYRNQGNWFSFEHCRFAEVEDNVAGLVMAFTYDQRKQEEQSTIELFLRFAAGSHFDELPDPRASEILTRIEEGDYYVSNAAVFPEFRGSGLGTALLEAVEREAIEKGCKRMVLDVETDNHRAARLWQKLGFRIEDKSETVNSSIKDFTFYKMAKPIGVSTVGR